MALNAYQIRKLRQERGWSQQALADRLGVNRTTVVRWEMDEVKPLPALLGLSEKTLEVKEEQ